MKERSTVPTADQIDLACRVAIATLYGDAHTAAKLIAKHDAHRPAIVTLDKKYLAQALVEAEQDLDRLINPSKQNVREFLKEANLLSHRHEDPTHAPRNRHDGHSPG